jgi:hypothetical protein
MVNPTDSSIILKITFLPVFALSILEMPLTVGVSLS